VRRGCLLAGLLAAAAGNLCASPTVFTCTLTNIGPTATTIGHTCFTFLNITPTDSLDWGVTSHYLSGTGESGLGKALPGNNFPITNSSGPDVRSAGGLNIQVQRAATTGSPSANVTRVDDLVYEWNGSVWQLPGGAGAPNVANFAGHFGSNAPVQPPVPGHPNAPPAGAPAGDQLVKMPNAGSSLELMFLNRPLFGVWFSIASLTCPVTSSNPVNTNCLFDATVQAFDVNGVSIGSYTLAESGTSGTGGACTGLGTRVPGPVPCNDAPYVGFYDPEGRIRSIYVSVFNHNGTTPVGFAIDSLYLEPIPEPAVPLMIGGGLAAMALYRRKRRSRVA